MMNILYASDNEYAEITLTSIFSLLESNKEVDDLRIFFIENDLSDRNIRKIENVCRKYGREIHFINMRREILPSIPNGVFNAGWNEAALARLFISSIFADHAGQVDKILYLDSDTLVMENLQGLYDTDLEDYILAAVPDHIGTMHKKALGLHKNDLYINSGVLLINVKKWIQTRTEHHFKEFIDSRRGKIPYSDQGIINHVLRGHIKPMPYRFNAITSAFILDYQQINIYHKPYEKIPEDQWNESIESPAIIHFTSFFLSPRPWQEGSKHPYARLWVDYFKIANDLELDTSDEAILQPSQRGILSALADLYSILPRNTAIQLTGFLHSYIKPLFKK